MKKILVPIAFFTLIFSSCKTSQLESYQDDIYANPSEEKKLAKLAAAEQAKKAAEEKQKQEEAALAQKAKDDANPYYKDPQYNSDDYYDYKYASKIRRFSNPINGAGYYNNYYTNSYMYNQNPAMYGSSIYSSYNYNMPSNQFNNYSNGLSIMFGVGYGNSYGGYNPYYGSYNPYYSNNYYGYGYNMYGGYNPYSYGYDPFAYNPYNPYGCGMGYSPYGMGYNNGFSYGYNMGYYNAYDPNSSYSSNASYGPRGNNGGGNSSRQTSAGMLVPEENGSRMQFIKEVATIQESAPKFIDVPRKVYNTNGSENFGGGQSNSSEPIKTRTSYANDNYQNNSSNTNSAPKKEDSFWPKVFTDNQNSNPGRTTNSSSENPRNENTKPEKIRSSQFENNNNSSFERSNNSGNSNNGAGSSSPRGGGGGSNRPR